MSKAYCSNCGAGAELQRRRGRFRYRRAVYRFDRQEQQEDF